MGSNSAKVEFKTETSGPSELTMRVTKMENHHIGFSDEGGQYGFDYFPYEGGETTVLDLDYSPSTGPFGRSCPVHYSLCLELQGQASNPTIKSVVWSYGSTSLIYRSREFDIERLEAKPDSLHLRIRFKNPAVNTGKAQNMELTATIPYH